MKLRHHRKRMQRAMASLVVRSLVVRRRRGRAMLVSSARRCGKTFAAQRWYDERENTSLTDAYVDALKYGFGVFRYQHQQPFEALELSPVDRMAREIVQAAELYDRTLDHYVRPGGLEAIPAPHHMRASLHYYEQRLRAACLIYGPEIRSAARRYSTSADYEQWLRENPPKARA